MMGDRVSITGLGESISNAVLRRTGQIAARVQETRSLNSDLLESEDDYLVVFDAPGATSSDVQVRYNEGAVLVRIDRFREHRSGFEMLFPGRGLSLDGVTDLPDDARVDPDGAAATLTPQGTLEVRIPKRDTDDTDDADAEETDDADDIDDEA